MICENQPEGQHLVVRCQGCSARLSTKNIGATHSETKVVYLQRSLFDIYNEFCTCSDSSEYPLVHDCLIDDIEYNYQTKEFEPIK